jgi:hypothetical protein
MFSYATPLIATFPLAVSLERLLKEKKKIVGSAALKGEVPKKAERVSEAVSLDEVRGFSQGGHPSLPLKYIRNPVMPLLPSMMQVWDEVGTAVKAQPVAEHDTLKSLERNLLLRDRTSGPGETERRHPLKENKG